MTTCPECGRPLPEDVSLSRPQGELLASMADEPGYWWGPSHLASVTYPGTRRHSAYASPKLKALEQKGLVERREPGHYRLTEAGLKRAREIRRKRWSRDED